MPTKTTNTAQAEKHVELAEGHLTMVVEIYNKAAKRNESNPIASKEQQEQDRLRDHMFLTQNIALAQAHATLAVYYK